MCVRHRTIRFRITSYNVCYTKLLRGQVRAQPADQDERVVLAIVEPRMRLVVAEQIVVGAFFNAGVRAYYISNPFSYNFV